MSKFDPTGVHVFKKTPGSPVWALSEVHPLMRFGNGDDVLFIQHGRVWTAGGAAVAAKDIPAWFTEAVAKANPAALAECGYKPTAPTETAVAKARAKRLAAQQGGETNQAV